MFLVGGFAESPMLQTEIRREFQHVLKIIIPNEVSLAVLRGQSRTSQGHFAILSISPLEAAFYIDFYPLDVKLLKEKFGRRNHYFDFRLET